MMTQDDWHKELLSRFGCLALLLWFGLASAIAAGVWIGGGL